jgi:nifR3 family TIM-barrel protein
MQSDLLIAELAKPLAVGPIVLPNRVFLAPMSGVSDVPFRAIASAYGAGLVVSEMVASEMLARGDAESLARAERAGNGPHVVQLAGREVRWMAEGARAATDAGADIIDINMGCPAKKVTGGYSGSALMRDLDHALTLIEAAVGATSLPVTLKMRLGWDDGTINAPELARRAERAGIQLITVHGRTRCQFYSGNADWQAIRAVKDAVSIPVVANGDLTSIDELSSMLVLSGADGVMIGRGAYGRPWLPGHVAAFAASGVFPAVPTNAALLELVRRHYDAILKHYGRWVGIKAARKHLGWYMANTAVAPAIRTAIMTGTDTSTVSRLLGVAFPDDAKAAA